ncbi:MAG: tRNA lysidine(34) synthetase TilS [Candidatus Thioglobus sp.]|nr:tRNA lysidine(34) synthetase TilS [Candidatus Thioglobus pontius]MBL6976752.1 tRNA lysidine(34) synthetase TilS [Candidatus Thioglobus sp.]MBL6984394.1 tRNA lysidine(34) synthetase TilS [Candidatus Thioglobus sp.]
MESLKTKDTFLEGKNIALALSGGIDSIVLLHYLHSHYPNHIRAIHCNHHLSEYCNDWHLFCQNVCNTLNIPYSNIDLNIENSKNIEENARKSRYHSLSCNMLDNEVLCTAHHQQDQAETLLLQLFRGAGSAGLASMPKEKPLGKGSHYRPMLDISKAQIIDYAKTHKLNWIEDDSNKDTNFRRNFLRLEIIPKLSTIYKNLAKILSRSAKHQSEALKLTRELADIDLQSNNIINDSGRINTVELIKLETHRIKNILRHHLSLLGFLAPTDKVMSQIVDLLHAKQDAKPLVQWDDYEIRRYQQELYFINNADDKEVRTCPIQLELQNLPNFSIRYRAEGQRIKLPGKTHSQSLKKVLQEAGIPPWERNSLKMYYINDELRAMERLGNMEHAE